MAEIFSCGTIEEAPLAWDDNKLTFVVREPYPSRATQAGIVFGKIEEGDDFRIVSKMPTDGVLFSDGIEDDLIAFHAGSEISVRVAGRKGRLVAS